MKTLLLVLSLALAVMWLTSCSETMTQPMNTLDPNLQGPARDVGERIIPPVSTVINLGGYAFEDTAFPDAALYVSGGPPTLSFATTGDINMDLLMAADSNPDNYIFGTPVTFDLTFVDNRLVNDSGADLVLFELGSDDGALVSIDVGGGLVGPLPYLMVPTGFDEAGFSLNAVAINLDDFGIAPGAMIETIQINNDSGAVPGGTTISSSICAVAALNSAPPVIQVWLDIKPGSDENPVNTKSNGVVPVAVLGTYEFDVAVIDVSSLAFGPSGAAPVHDGHYEDVNGDGMLDLVLHFKQKQTGIADGDESACLTGLTVNGMPLEGCDTLRGFTPGTTN